MLNVVEELIELDKLQVADFARLPPVLRAMCNEII